MRRNEAKPRTSASAARLLRHYVLHPYQQVKDERTGLKVGNAQGVLDGDLDGFVREYLAGEGGGEGCLTTLSARMMRSHRCRSGACAADLPPQFRWLIRTCRQT